MKKQDLISVFITFSFGIFAGFYLYLTGFAPMANELSDIEIGSATKYSIVGEMYGGCRNLCPSFQVQNNGSYRYLYTPRVDGEQIVRQGTLPLPVQRQLKDSLNIQAILPQTEEYNPTNCSSFTDGIDTKYYITIGETEYIIDSCGTQVDEDGEISIALDNVWQYFESLGNNQ